ncbi:hypothetical protein [Mesorhizobium sp. WSM3860]|uniref:hypothetical protein n=1 Tax=Mesorhizobium sp. WSM3860 TaxID=2029403 RepID=UPI001596E86C|nr:hypothetical protein [Mesorhizobium sp. WSM3860]
MDPSQAEDEKKFNEKLKRMLKTPPKPHKSDGDGQSNQDGKSKEPATKPADGR